MTRPTTGQAPRCASGHRLLTIASGVVAAALSGCVVGPNYAPPAPPLIEGHTKELPRQPSGASGVATAQGGPAAQAFVPAGDVKGHW